MVRAVALALTVLTGFTALVYEVAWQKYLAVLLGSHSEATAAVLGIFLGGLSCGYAFFGRFSQRIVGARGGKDRASRLLFLYGVVETGIGVFALAFPILFQAAHRVSLWIPPGSEALAFGLDILLTTALIGPPTFLMGGTIPLLTQSLSRSLGDATRFHAFVYAFNTLGAFFGALCAGFFLVPWLGLRGSVAAMGVVNVSAGLAFVVLGRRSSGGQAPSEDALPARELPEGFRTYALVALISGFSMMTLQAAANRIGALALGASHFTFSMVVATFVLCIALGGFCVSALPRVRPSYLPVSQWALVAFLIGFYPLVDDAPFWAHVLRLEFPAEEGAFYPFHASVFVATLTAFLVPLVLSGAVLPLLFHRLRHEVGDLGRVAGRLYSWNTVGSLLGALLGGYALYFWLDLHQVYRLSVVALGAGAALLSLRVFARGKPVAVAGLAGTVVLTALQPPWEPERLSAGLFRERVALEHSYESPDAFFEGFLQGQSIAFYDDDPLASIAVLKTRIAGGESISILNNGKSDGAIPGDNMTMGLAGLLPALLMENPRRAFVIGYGTGRSVGELASLDSIREVIVAEIAPGVMRAAPLFDHVNHGASRSAKTRVVRSDAYRALLRSPERFDIILSEPSNPWLTGVEMLFTREFLQAARDRLTPRGIYVQWFHTYETNSETLALVLRTYLEAFDRVSVWVAQRSDVLILGFNDDDESIDLAKMEERWERADFRAGFKRIRMHTLAELLAHEILPIGVLNRVDLPGEVHTILHPLLSDRAARAFFVGGRGQPPVGLEREAAAAGAANSLLRRYFRKSEDGLSPETRDYVLRETCFYLGPERCATLFARWRFEEPHSPDLQSGLEIARRSPRLRSALSPDTLRQLESLFAPEGTSWMPPTHESAVRALDAFTAHYHHAAPFHSAALERVWVGCQSDPRCAEGLERVRGLGTDPSLAP